MAAALSDQSRLNARLLLLHRLFVVVATASVAVAAAAGRWWWSDRPTDCVHYTNLVPLLLDHNHHQ